MCRCASEEGERFKPLNGQSKRVTAAPLKAGDEVIAHVQSNGSFGCTSSSDDRGNDWFCAVVVEDSVNGGSSHCKLQWKHGPSAGSTIIHPQGVSRCFPLDASVAGCKDPECDYDGIYQMRCTNPKLTSGYLLRHSTFGNGTSVPPGDNLLRQAMKTYWKGVSFQLMPVETSSSRYLLTHNDVAVVSAEYDGCEMYFDDSTGPDAGYISFLI